MELTPQQEVFCQYYVKNDVMFGNATIAYAEAYDFKLDELSTEPQKDKDGKDIVRSSEYQRAYDACSASGSRLLRNVKIDERIIVLLNELMRDEVVDSELAKVIKQDYKLEAKVAAIREYNKLKGRIIEKRDITTDGKPLTVNLVQYGDNPPAPVSSETVPVTVS